MKKNTHILLLGLGYVSVWAYKNLVSTLGPQIKSGEVQITVVSTSDYHAFHGFTGEFLAGMLPVGLRRTPQAKLLTKANFVHGKALSIRQEEQAVLVQNFHSGKTERIEFDHLVVGIGSVDNDAGIPGFREYGLGVKKENGIAECRKRILAAVEAASKSLDPKQIDAALSFAVVGGGFAGIEVCGNLCEYLRELSTVYSILRKHAPKVYWVHPGEEALPQLAEGGFSSLLRYCKRQLEKEGVITLSQARLKEIKASAFELDNGMCIPSRTVICCIGQKIVPLASPTPFMTDLKGRMETSPQLQAVGYCNIWAGGDAARVMHISGKKECRADALWAIKQGRRIGRNIARSIKGKKPLRFSFPGMGQTASLGMNKAILELYGICLTGRLAWWIRLGFFLYYMPHRSQVGKAIRAFLQPRRLWELDGGSFEFQVSGSEHIPETRNPKPETRNPKPETRNPKPETSKPKRSYPILSNPV